MTDGTSDLYKLGLSLRALNCLRRGRIDSIRDLSNCTDEQLLSIRGMGGAILAEVRRNLEQYQLEEQWEETQEEPVHPMVHNTQDYQTGAAMMRLAILSRLDEMTRAAQGVRWVLLREVTRMIRTMEVPQREMYFRGIKYEWRNEN